MNTYDQVLQIKSDFETKAEAVKKSVELTPVGKDKRLAALKDEKLAVLSGLVGPLRKAAVLDALEVKKFTRVKSALKSIEAEQMDFAKLSYFAGSVRSSLALAAGDPQKILEKFRLAKESGNRVLIKAWIDTAPETFPANTGPDLAWFELRADMAASAGAADSGEMAGYENQRRAHLESLADTLRVTQKIAEDVGEEASFRGKNLVERVFEGIQPDPVTGELQLDFGETANESPEGTFARLEAEYATRAAEQAAVMKHWDEEYNPILDGVPPAHTPEGDAEDAFHAKMGGMA